MPIRNPFRRAGVPDHVDDVQPTTPESGFKDTTTFSGPKPLQRKDPAEYKLSGETCKAARASTSAYRCQQTSTTAESTCP